VLGHGQRPVYILLGQKRSGSIYSSQDIKILDILADELVIAIQNSLRFEEIKRFNITLQEKVEEATKELRHANHRLRELDATKDEFISMASHQLRTPLTTIKGYLSMVLEGDVGPVTKDERKMIQQAFDGAERMVYLIADLLNISRLQSGKFVIDNKPTDLAKMVQSEVEQLTETATHHQLKLTFEKPDKFPLINIDETKIRQVIMNFMDNAIYYTPAGGSIGVALEVTDSEIRYTVTDTGLGVPKAEQHHLFSKFYRAGNARKMRPDGTGLGLFMAKKVVVAQGGAIIFKSTEGKGSTFGFSFPRAKVEVMAKPAAKPEAEPVTA
jgi:signal transduction histidine kinase